MYGPWPTMRPVKMYMGGPCYQMQGQPANKAKYVTFSMTSVMSAPTSGTYISPQSPCFAHKSLHYGGNIAGDKKGERGSHLSPALRCHSASASLGLYVKGKGRSLSTFSWCFQRKDWREKISQPTTKDRTSRDCNRVRERHVFEYTSVSEAEIRLGAGSSVGDGIQCHRQHCRSPTSVTVFSTYRSPRWEAAATGRARAAPFRMSRPDRRESRLVRQLPRPRPRPRPKQGTSIEKRTTY